FILRLRHPPRATLFPYTTLFRSTHLHATGAEERRRSWKPAMNESGSVVPFIIEDKDQAEAERSGGRGIAFAEAKRMAEALVFASAAPVSSKALAERLPDGVDVRAVMEELREDYANRGVNLVRVDDHWAFRTAGDLSFLMSRDQVQ